MGLWGNSQSDFVMEFSIQALGKLQANFGLTLGQLWANFGLTDLKVVPWNIWNTSGKVYFIQIPVTSHGHIATSMESQQI